MCVLSTIYFYSKNTYYFYKIHTSLIDKDLSLLDTEMKKNSKKYEININFNLRRPYNTEFSKWNYNDNVLDIINLDKSYNGKLQYNDDKLFYKKFVEPNIVSTYSLGLMRSSPYVKNKLKNINDNYFHLIIYLGSHNIKELNLLLNTLENILSKKIKFNKILCDEQFKKINEISEFRSRLLLNNYTIEKNFKDNWQDLILDNYSCDHTYFEKSTIEIKKKYNNKLFILCLIFFNILITIPLIITLKK